jgi:hypothetical protein
MLKKIIRYLLGIEKPMVGFYFKIKGIELTAHFQRRIDELKAHEHRIKTSGIVLTDKQIDAMKYKIQCYEFALHHIDSSYTYFLDETEVGQWELIRAYDAFDKLEMGTPAAPRSNILRPSIIH